MAIKVGGTTVIDDSRALNNISSVDATTVAALGTAGVGAGGGSLDAIASGTISTGDTIIINSNGTVSAVGITGTSFSYGSTTNYYNTEPAFYAVAAFDSGSNKVVVAYRNDTQYPMAVVGNVSGTSISFGTPVTLNSVAANAQRPTCVAYDSNSNKVVVGYAGYNNSFKAKVGTVSGTSISFGSDTNINGNYSAYDTVGVFDSNRNKVVFASRNINNSTSLDVCIGTVSGTSVSWTSPYSVDSSTESYSMVFDSSTNKTVITFKKSQTAAAVVGFVNSSGSWTVGSVYTLKSSGAAGGFTASAFNTAANKIVHVYTAGSITYARVGTTNSSDNSISFGTEKVIYNVGTLYDLAADYSVEYDRVIVSARKIVDGTSSVTYIPLEVSGTDIIVGSSGDLPTATSSNGGIVYDANAEKMVSFYTNSSTNRGDATVIDGGDAATNLSLTNFIGFSDSNYSNSQTASVQLVSAVNENQSGLTATKKYYVMADGSLAETDPDLRDIYAGTAVSATKIIVKG